MSDKVGSWDKKKFDLWKDDIHLPASDSLGPNVIFPIGGGPPLLVTYVGSGSVTVVTEKGFGHVLPKYPIIEIAYKDDDDFQSWANQTLVGAGYKTYLYDMASFYGAIGHSTTSEMLEDWIGPPSGAVSFFWKAAKSSPDTRLAELMPDLWKNVTCPNKDCAERRLLAMAKPSHIVMPTCQARNGPRKHPLKDMIIHLNDRCHWTREQIADWLETLDVDLSFPVAVEDGAEGRVEG